MIQCKVLSDSTSPSQRYKRGLFPSAGFDSLVLHIGRVFDGLESIFPAKGECGGQEVEVVHLGVKSSDVGFSNLADADDILNI